MAAIALLSVLTAPNAPQAQPAGAPQAGLDAGFESALQAAGAAAPPGVAQGVAQGVTEGRTPLQAVRTAPQAGLAAAARWARDRHPASALLAGGAEAGKAGMLVAWQASASPVPLAVPVPLSALVSAPLRVSGPARPAAIPSADVLEGADGSAPLATPLPAPHVPAAPAQDGTQEGAQGRVGGAAQLQASAVASGAGLEVRLEGAGAQGAQALPDLWSGDDPEAAELRLAAQPPAKKAASGAAGQPAILAGMAQAGREKGLPSRPIVAADGGKRLAEQLGSRERRDSEAAIAQGGDGAAAPGAGPSRVPGEVEAAARGVVRRTGVSDGADAGMARAAHAALGAAAASSQAAASGTGPGAQEAWQAAASGDAAFSPAVPGSAVPGSAISGPAASGASAASASPVSTAAAPPLTTPVAPAEQLGQAVAALHLGGGHVSIRLNPQELGEVEIQLRRSQEGGAVLSLAVERPETLRALQADLTHLHQALDQAGLPAEQRQVTLHLASADTGAGAGQPGANFGTAGQGGGGGGRGGGEGSSSGHQRADRQASGHADLSDAAAAAANAPARAGWRPAGFDITA